MFSISSIHTISKKYELPDFVKDAQNEDISIITYTEELPDHAFAYPAKRFYPCHNKIATFYSIAQFFEDSSNIPEPKRTEIRRNLEKFATIHDIPDLVGKIEREYLDKKEQDLTKYAYEVGKIKMFPIKNENEAKIASQYLLDNWKDFDYRTRKLIASNILKIANEENYNLSKFQESLEKVAGQGYFNAEGLRKLVKECVYYAKQVTGELGEKFTKIASKIEPIINSINNDDKQLIDDYLDFCTFVIKEANAPLNIPEFYVYPIAASEVDDFKNDILMLKSGAFYDINKIPAFTKTILRDYFSEEELQDLPEYVTRYSLRKFASNLNPVQTSIFEKLLKDLNINPSYITPVKVSIPEE